jgi:hypothetical protein
VSVSDAGVSQNTESLTESEQHLLECNDGQKTLTKMQNLRDQLIRLGKTFIFYYLSNFTKKKKKSQHLLYNSCCFY